MTISFRKNKTLISIIAIAACISSVFLMRAFKPSPEEALKKRVAQRSKGDQNAPIKITEYFDYQCGACAKADKILKDLINTNPGKIHLQANFYPLSNHKHSVKAAVYAECVSRQKDKFWPFHEEVLENQATWQKDPHAQIRFAAYAKSIGADLRRLDACVNDPQVERLIAGEKKTASELGVKMTPSFFINGKFVVGTEKLIEELKQLNGSVCTLENLK